MRFVSIQVLIVVVELDVAGGECFEGLAVVLDVVGAKTRVTKVNVHITIGGGDVAAPALCF
jgi:hypothetical protein